MIYGPVARPDPVRERVLALDLKGALSSTADFNWLNRRRLDRPPFPVRDLSRRRCGQDDSRVKAVSLDLDNFSVGGQVAAASGRALRRLRSSRQAGERVCHRYSDDGYSSPPRVGGLLSPLARVVLAGPAARTLFTGC